MTLLPPASLKHRCSVQLVIVNGQVAQITKKTFLKHKEDRCPAQHLQIFSSTGLD